MTKEYIAYRREQPLGIGTIEELAESLGFTDKNMKRRTYPSAHKNMSEGSILLYEIEDDEDDNQIKPERL